VYLFVNFFENTNIMIIITVVEGALLAGLCSLLYLYSIELCLTVLICFINCHKPLFWLLFYVPSLFELPTALLEYLDVLQGAAAPLPLWVATPIWLWYNIAAQPYYCWWTMHTANNCIKTIALHFPLTYFRLKRRRFVTSYVQPFMQQYE